MKSPDKHIGSEPFANVNNTLVRASAYQDFFTVFLNYNILLVSKIIGYEYIIN